MKCVFENVILYDKKSGKKKDGTDWYWLKFRDDNIFVSGFTSEGVFNCVDATCNIDIRAKVSYSRKDKCLIYNFVEVL